MKRLSVPTLVVASLVVLILLARMFTYQVGFNQVAVKVRLGQADEDSVVREPGLKLKWPPPIERVVLFDTRLRTLDLPETEIKTVDGKNVIVGLYAVWRVADALQFFKERDRAEEQMRSRIAQQMAAVIGQASLADFVNLDAAQVDRNYDRLLAEMRDLTAERDGQVVHVGGVWQGLMNDYGVDVVELGVRRISLPKETTQQVFESMRQERSRIATRYREEGKSRAAAIVAQAEQQEKQILAFAQRLAQEIRSAGTQAATRIYAQIQTEDREFFEWLRWLDALRAALAQRTTIFLDQNSPLWAPFVQPPVPAPARPQ